MSIKKEATVPPKENKEKVTKKSQSKVEETQKRHKIEFSKILCITAVIIFTLVAVFTIMDYYALMRLAIVNGSGVVPDASLPIAGITSILAAVLSYCLYQGLLKNSLNKNQLTIDENGIIKPILDKVIHDEYE